MVEGASNGWERQRKFYLVFVAFHGVIAQTPYPNHKASLHKPLLGLAGVHGH